MSLEEAARVVVCSVVDLPEGSRRLVVPFRGRAGIGVFNVNGSYHALRNLCPHKLGPLGTGRVSGRVVAAAPPSAATPALEVVREGEAITCPRHRWEFGIAS